MLARTELVADWLAELDKWGLDRTRTISTAMIEEAIDLSPELWPSDNAGFVCTELLSSTLKDLCEIAILNNQLITNAFIDLEQDIQASTH